MSSKSFTIMVSKSPFDYRNAELALNFCAAALANAHKIEQVFFYQTGVHNASSLLLPNNDEINVYQKWCELHENHNVPLFVCVTAAARRGVLSQEQTNSHTANLNAPFKAVGLSAYFEALQGNTVNVQL